MRDDISRWKEQFSAKSGLIECFVCMCMVRLQITLQILQIDNAWNKKSSQRQQLGTVAQVPSESP